MRAPDDERAARVALMWLTEPNDVRLWGLVGRLGPVHALARVTGDGRPGPGDPRARDYRARLPVPEPLETLDAAAAMGARFIVPGDLEWPTQLDQLDLPRGPGDDPACPPLGLWVRGQLDLRRTVLRSAAVVGARAATGYGVRVAADMAGGLADRGWALVSGAAYGIDAAAHRGALAAAGSTVAVLACGVDIAYPRAHHGLLARLVDEGLVVSELPPGSRPTRARFLDRNRLIAALTPATVVVEAALRSGALNTARWARRLDRRVLAVPGPVTSPLSAGPHLEIRDRGAVLVTDAGQVVADAGSMGDALVEAEREHEQAQLLRAAAARPIDALSATHRAVLDALDADSFLPVDVVAGRAMLLTRVVEGCLADLADAGLAERGVERGGCRWRAVGARHPTAERGRAGARGA
jgi:DNA processing protein